MTSAKLKMNTWDDLTLIFTPDTGVTSFVRITDRYQALEIYRQLFVEQCHLNTNQVIVNMGSQSYVLDYQVWQLILDAFDQWYEEYMLEVEFGDTVENM